MTTPNPFKPAPTASVTPPEYYQSVITRFSWWITRDGSRRFVIVYIRYDDPNTPGRYEPVTVGILEVNREDPVDRPWSAVVRLVTSGQLVKVKAQPVK